MEQEVIYNTKQIQEILPHRYPFLLVDKIVEYSDNERIVGIKNVTFNEPFFPGHFPDQPVMPGVLILESMAQTGAILAHESDDGVEPGMRIYFAAANDVKWKRMVFPGDTLRIEMTSLRKRKPLWTMKGVVTVDGQMVAMATVTAAQAPNNLSGK